MPTGKIDRRGFLKCMQWAGTGALWTLAGGLPQSRLLEAEPQTRQQASGFSFVQISDSHIGFNKPVNADVAGTLRAAVEKINALDPQPDFIIHTGDITHLAKAAEFDTTGQVLRELRQKQVFYVPGEHDLVGDDGRQYLERFGKGSKGRGWYSFDHKGAHFVALNNSVQVEGLGKIGRDQLDWMKDDLRAVASSTPVVVFAHIPLWAVYPQWGWSTEDSEEAMDLLKRFGSVTVLNGHIHQVLQKVEDRVAFHTAMSTAFPQPVPGTAPAPGPMTVPAEKLRSVLGIAGVAFVPGRERLAVVDSALAAPSSQTAQVFDGKCTGCHSLDRNKVGPPLRGIYGRRAAQAPGFPYSESLKKAHLTWDGPTLDKWLADPTSIAPDTDMSIRLDSASDRAAIIEYLRSLR